MASTTTPNDLPVYRIPECNWSKFTADMAALIKRANKIGVPAPTFAQVGVEVEEIREADEQTGALVPTGAVRLVHLVIVTGDSPCFDGWALTAVIDIDTDEPDAPNLVHVRTGEKDPAWSTMTSRCDHCGTNIATRKTLIVVDHEDGERKVVGSSCLRDFLGHASPASIASWAEVILALDDSMAEYEDDEFFGGGSGEQRFDPQHFMAFVIRDVADRGYHKTSADHSTRDAAVMMITARKDRPAPPSDSELNEARTMIAWALDQTPGESDYIDNLIAICSKQGWRSKDLGISASLATAYRRAQEREALNAAKAAAVAAGESHHIGTVGLRGEFGPLTVTGVLAFEGFYGMKYLVKMIDADGAIVIWWASTSNHPEPGEIVTGKATVKEHGEFNGEAQTNLTRFTWKAVEPVAA